MQIGLITDPKKPLADDLAWVAGAGFAFAEVRLEPPGAALESTEWRAVAQSVADLGIGVICRAPDWLPLASPSPLARQAALDELRRSIDAAALLGAPLIAGEFAGWPAHLSEAAGYEYCRQAYGIVLRHAEQQGIAFGLANRAENRHQLKYFREIFHRLPGLKLAYDIGHGNVGTAKSMTRDYLFALADRLAHVTLSDNDGSADDHLPFGAPQAGGIDLGHELRGLRSFRYDGTLTLDLRGDRRWALACRDLLSEEWEKST